MIIDAEVKIPIVAEADITGFEKTQEAVRQTGEEVQRAAQGIDPYQQALVAQMELEGKTIQELRKEILRLKVARQEASKAGDAEKFKELTDQISRTKKAYGDLKNAANLNKAALMGQASAGLQFANTLGTLSTQLKSGKADLAGVANGVLSLSMAIKAGLGPIGWAMAAIQGLSAAWEAVSKAEEKATEKLQAQLDRRKEAANKLEAVGRQVVAAWTNATEDNARRQMAALDRLQEKQKDMLNFDLEAARQRRDAENARLQGADDIALEKMQQRVALGKATTDEEVKARLAAEDRVSERARKNTQEELAGKVAAAQQVYDQSVQRLEALNKTEANLKKDLNGLWQRGENEKVTQLMDQLQAMKGDLAHLDEGIASAQAFINEAEEKGPNWIERQLSVVSDSWERELKNLEDAKKYLQNWLQSRQATQERYDNVLEALAKELGIDKRRADAAFGELQESLQKRQKLQAQQKEAQAAVDRAAAELDAVRQAEEYNRENETIQNAVIAERRKTAEAVRFQAKKEEEWGTLQKENYTAQEAYAREAMAAMQAGSEEWKKWQARAEQAAAAGRHEDWQEVQTKTLQEQETYLEKMLAATKEGTREYEQWAREARRLNNKKIGEELAALENTYQVAGNYAAQDSRTQAAIHAADLKALEARRAALEKLKNTPDIDAATLKAVNQKIDDTDKQLRGLRLSMKQAALEAQRAVAALKPLGEKAKLPNLQGPLKQAEKTYNTLAKRAARQAEKGDLQGLERTKKAMQRSALAQEKLAGYSGRAAALHKSTLGHLQAIAQGTAAQDLGLTAEQKQENQVRESLGQKRRHTARQAKAAEKSAKAKENEAEADKKAAASARKNAQASTPTQQVNRTAQLTADVNSLRLQVQQMETAQLTLNSNMGGLGDAVGKLAAAAEHTASLAGQMATAASAALGRLERKISSLEKNIDRLNRKIS